MDRYSKRPEDSVEAAEMLAEIREENRRGVGLDSFGYSRLDMVNQRISYLKGYLDANEPLILSGVPLSNS